MNNSLANNIIHVYVVMDAFCFTCPALKCRSLYSGCSALKRIYTSLYSSCSALKRIYTPLYSSCSALKCTSFLSVASDRQQWRERQTFSSQSWINRVAQCGIRRFASVSIKGKYRMLNIDVIILIAIWMFIFVPKLLTGYKHITSIIYIDSLVVAMSYVARLIIYSYITTHLRLLSAPTPWHSIIRSAISPKLVWP